MNETALTLVPLADTLQLGKVLAESGFFADSRGAAQAVVKVLAGRELGFGPVASMTGINIISGRVSLSANLIAAAVKRSGRYNYRVVTLTDSECRMDFFEKGERIGTSTFTAEDARRAGTKNMDKFPRNMLFARTISNGAKWYCADIFGGPIYTPEELGADVNEDGDYITSTATVITESISTDPAWDATTSASAERPSAPPKTAEQIGPKVSNPDPPLIVDMKPETARAFGRILDAAPTPQPSGPIRPAAIDGAMFQTFNAWAADFATANPHWQNKAGKADFNALCISIARSGYERVTVADWNAITAAMTDRAAKYATPEGK